MSVIHEDNIYMSLTSDGTYTWTLPVYAQVFCNMDLYYFPFDKHTCTMTISSLSNPTEEMWIHLLDDNPYHSSYTYVLLMYTYLLKISTSIITCYSL